MDSTRWKILTAILTLIATFTLVTLLLMKGFGAQTALEIVAGAGLVAAEITRRILAAVSGDDEPAASKPAAITPSPENPHPPVPSDFSDRT